MSSGLLSVPSLIHSLISAFLHLVFMGRWNHYYCTETTVILPLSVIKTISFFERTPKQTVCALPLFPPLVSVYQKCDTLRLPNGWRLMKYLCVDMTGQCVVHVEGHLRSKQALNVLDGWIFFFERFCGVDCNILRAHDEVTQGDVKRKTASTLLEYACPPPRPHLYPPCV